MRAKSPYNEKFYSKVEGVFVKATEYEKEQLR